MVAEQKARTVYEKLNKLNRWSRCRLLLWLRQREIDYYDRFKELFEYSEKKFKNLNDEMNEKAMLIKYNMEDFYIQNFNFNNYENYQ